MADLTQVMESPVVTAIYNQYEAQFGNEAPRVYMGASIIGKECRRALWYDFRLINQASSKPFSGRMYRLFQTGHLAESRFVKDLRDIGAEVYDADPSTGKQFGFASLGGHMRGHMDGAAHKVPSGGDAWHCCEFKTHGDKSFNALKKDGLEKSKPQHYAQLMWYMGKSGMNRGLYLAVNKNTDELYAERVRFDPIAFEKIEAKAEAIIFATEPPAKLSNDPKYYVCNMCDHKDVCHGNRVPALNCRTCVHSTPERDGDGRWSCAKHKADIPQDVQRIGCDDHLPLPFLLTYAEATDAGDGWIIFRVKGTGAEFAVSAGGLLPAGIPLSVPIYSSREISAIKDYRAIADPEVEKLRADFHGEIVG